MSHSVSSELYLHMAHAQNVGYMLPRHSSWDQPMNYYGDDVQQEFEPMSVISSVKIHAAR